ncbi:hypothetical protein D9619_005308 [Psilocybe cf. subviscida]|uniref:SH3 domain-containing protein n=1 Tax=Psilocybe cf. subviscida TaxID=2480587 RepID=A0A8H5BYC4_9AGAR|nr:hypothetical protein D9619_005308 [Psilocybe cf. subviscida]
MSDTGARVAHRRMMKVVKLEAREDVAYPSQQSLGASGTMASAQATSSPSPTSAPFVSALPVSTAAIAGVGAFLVLLVILVAGGCFWRRRKLRAKKANSSTIQFDRDVFAAEKKSYGLQAHLVADLSSIPMQSPTETTSSPRIQHTPTESESSTYVGWKPQASAALRVANQTTPADRTTSSSSYLQKPPKALSKKHSLSQHLKPLWSPAPEDLARSPPPAYDFSNGVPGLYFPSPSDLQKQKTAARTPAPPPTPAANKPAKLTIPSVLTVPETEHTTLPSPARSESFAPKDLVVPQTKNVASLDDGPGSSVTQTPPSSSGSTQTFNSSTSSGKKLPRMMTVSAAYTPTLPDELRVTVGDTVRLLQEYKDGWGFAQYVGKIDSPKGVVPMVCLQERRRMVPSIQHKTSTGSNGSQSSVTGWR